MTRILIVDDDEQLRRSLVRLLERAGHDCATASDGDEVMGAVRDARPDVVLMDLMMPRRSGLEAFRDLRGDPGTAPIPVILMTARSDLLPYVASMLGPGDDQIAKPFDLGELEGRVAMVLRRAGGRGSGPAVREDDP